MVLVFSVVGWYDHFESVGGGRRDLEDVDDLIPITSRIAQRDGPLGIKSNIRKPQYSQCMTLTLSTALVGVSTGRLERMLFCGRRRSVHTHVLLSRVRNRCCGAGAARRTHFVLSPHTPQIRPRGVTHLRTRPGNITVCMPEAVRSISYMMGDTYPDQVLLCDKRALGKVGALPMTRGVRTVPN